jgi:hypothetical protein
LHAWITHYIDDPEIKKQVEMIDINNERLFGGEKLEIPDFGLEFPSTLTKDTYLKMLKKIFAAIRYKIYCQIRAIVRNRE